MPARAARSIWVRPRALRARRMDSPTLIVVRPAEAMPLFEQIDKCHGIPLNDKERLVAENSDSPDALSSGLDPRSSARRGNHDRRSFRPDLRIQGRCVTLRKANRKLGEVVLRLIGEFLLPDSEWRSL